MIGDEDAAVAMDLETVRLDSVFGNDTDISRWRNSEDPSPGHIHYVQVACAIERRPLKKTVGWIPAAVNIDPIRAASVNAISIRNSREHPRFDSGWGWIHYSDLLRQGSVRTVAGSTQS